MNSKYEAWTNSWGIGADARPGGNVAPDISELADFRDDTLLERRQREVDALSREEWLATLDPDLREMFLAREAEIVDEDILAEEDLDPIDEIVRPDQPDTPPDEAFGAALNARAEARFTANRMAATDQATMVAVTQERQKRLKEVLGENHPLVVGYGLRTIQTKRDKEKRAGMRIENPFSSPYHRDEPGALHMETLDGLVADKIGHAPEPGEVYYVSDLSMLKRMQALYGDDLSMEGIDPPVLERHEIAPGVFAIQCTPPLVPAAPEDEESNSDKEKRLKNHNNMMHQLYSVGGFPSAYDIVKAAHPTDLDPLTLPTPDPSPENNAKIAKVLDAAGTKTLAAAVESGHDHANVAGAAVSILKGLQTALAKGDDLKKLAQVDGNPAVANALDEIARLCELMPAFLDDAPRLARLYDLLIDEVHLVLAVVKPYDSKDIKDAATQGITRKSPTLQGILDDTDVTAESFLLASGMDALSSAVVNALEITHEHGLTLGDAKKDDDRKLTADYFEVGQGLLKNEALFAEDGQVMVLTLNPSTPVTTLGDEGPASWDVSNVIKKLLDRLGSGKALPVIAILDITIEKAPRGKETEELEQLFAAVGEALADGSLVLTVNKSYQKYPSMGSGKILSGGATVIGKGPLSEAISKGLGADETSGGCLEKEESQLACHFLNDDEDRERALLAKAAENASFVKDFFIGSDADHKSDPSVRDKNYFGDGLPYLVIGGQGEAFDVEDRVWGDAGAASNKPAPMHIMWEMGVEQKMSFGFHTTSALPMPGGTRIALGQESKGDLVELLFAVGKLTYTPENFNANRSANEEAARIRKMDNADIDDWRVDIEDAAAHPEEDEDDEGARKRIATAKAVSEVKKYVDAHPDLHGSGFNWDVASGPVELAVADYFETNFPKKSKRKKDKAYNGELKKKAALAVHAGIRALAPSMKQGVMVSDIENVAVDAASVAMPAATKVLDQNYKSLENDNGRARFLANLLIKAGMLEKGDVKRGEDEIITHPALDELEKAYAALKSSVAPKPDLALVLDDAEGMDDAEEIAPADRLRRQMAIYSSTTEPYLTDEDRMGDDPSIMHSKVERRWKADPPDDALGDDVNVAFLPNIVASCALLSEAVFDDRQNAKLAIVATDALMDVGMDGISNETRQALLTRRIGLMTLEDAEVTPDDLAKLKQACDLMPYPEGAATAFIDNLPDGPFEDSQAAEEIRDEMEERVLDFADELAEAALGTLPTDYLKTILTALLGGEDTPRDAQPAKAAVILRMIDRRNAAT